MTNDGLTVNVSRTDLLAKLRENRAAHEEAYARAMEGYTKHAIAELEKKLAAAKAGKEVDRYIKNVPPDKHTQEYDEVIGMLEMSGQETIVLCQSDFRQYVRDDWGWKQQWTTSNTGYMKAAGR